MRTMLYIFSMGILIMLVAAGLNLCSRGIDDLTLNERGPVIAVRLHGNTAYIDALGDTYQIDEDFLNDGQALLYKEAARCRSYVRGFWRQER